MTALTVAGTDPSGGAGLQADLRAFAAVGVAGVSVVTAITAQNSSGVLGVYPVPSRQLAAQMAAILSDVPVRAVKIGMLGGRAQVEAVVATLRRFQPPNVVLDPVLASSGGVPLLSPSGRDALLAHLLPLCDLVTPNLAETETLTGEDPRTREGAEAGAALLLARGARAVLVKGGHLPGPPVDLLFRPGVRPLPFAVERVETQHTHGTGCLLSAAVAAHLALGASLETAIGAAKERLTRALRHPIVLGRGLGYPDASDERPGTNDEPSSPNSGRNSLWWVVGNSSPDRTDAHQELLERLRGLYLVADAGLRPDREPERIVAAALAGGARIIQLRDKRRSTAELVPMARRLCRMTRASGGVFIVNDRVDVALAADADGVHLGPEDLAPVDARRLLGPDRLVGVSVSSIAEAGPLADHSSYFGVGAIFATATKADAGPPIGLEPIRAIHGAFPSHPIVAIGGIGAGSIRAVLYAGAAAAAVVSAVVAAPDMARATRELIERIEDGA